MSLQLKLTNYSVGMTTHQHLSVTLNILPVMMIFYLGISSS